MNRRLVVAAALVVGAAAVSGPRWRRLADGVVVDAAGVHVRLRACSDQIVRVTAWPDGAAEPSRPSLAVRERWGPARFDVRADERSIVLSTTRLRARVGLATGEVSFEDATGRPLLREPDGGGKAFRRVTLQGETTYEVSQAFEARDDEGLYGLGQHQDRLLDLRGRDLDLWQHNREIVIPLLASSRGWGVLWDNPSHMRFGSPEDVVPVPPSSLLDETGRPGGLTAAYFSDRDLREPLGPPGVGLPRAAELPAEATPKIRAVRWTGYLLPSATGEYGIYSHRALNDVRLWLDDALLINYWSLFVRADEAARVPLEAGRRHRLKIEWRRGDANGPFDLRWLPPRAAVRPARLWSASGEGIDYYFVHGASLDGVIAGYREATGRAPLLPKWAYGYWQSRERYKSAAELVDVVREFRRRRFPLDVIVQDWRYWRDQQWGSHEFDPARFPDPKGMVDEVHGLGARVPISVWPKFDKGTVHFQQMRRAGFLYPFTLDRGIKDWLGDEFSFYDAFNPEGRRLFWRQMKDTLVAKGFDGWWIDADEPNLIDDPTPEEQAEIINPTALGPGSRVLNAYPLAHVGGLYEELRQAAPDRRVAILTRSAWAGSQRHGAIAWSGDTVGRWEVLRAQVPAGLSYSLSGLPYWTHDIGGFSVDYPGGHANEEYRELFVRWFQFGAFCPIFRAHGQTTEREPWFFGGPDDRAYRALLRFAELRYRLLPYIYSLAARVTFDHDTIMRALVMDFPEDAKARQTSDQFLFGPALLVSPVMEAGARARRVYLPAGRWYDFWTGNPVEGGQTVDAPAPYDSLPLHVRAGSIVPFGPPRQHAFDGPDDPLTLYVYAGRDGAFSLYEDDGLTNAYETGAWSRIPITWRDADRTLTLGARADRFAGAPKERTFEAVLVRPGAPAVMGAGHGVRVGYEGREIVLALGREGGP
jgi:alpha-D-xyloside xylohydrolase